MSVLSSCISGRGLQDSYSQYMQASPTGPPTPSIALMPPRCASIFENAVSAPGLVRSLRMACMQRGSQQVACSRIVVRESVTLPQLPRASIATHVTCSPPLKSPVARCDSDGRLAPNVPHLMPCGRSTQVVGTSAPACSGQESTRGAFRSILAVDSLSDAVHPVLLPAR